MRKPLNVLQKVLTVNNFIGYGPESKHPRHSKQARRGKTNSIGANDATNVGFISVFSYHQQRIYNLLSDGIPRSAADITISLRMSDPRSVIRDLRHKGVPIADEWCEGVHGGRFKRYFIRKGGVQWMPLCQ